MPIFRGFAIYLGILTLSSSAGESPPIMKKGNVKSKTLLRANFFPRYRPEKKQNSKLRNIRENDIDTSGVNKENKKQNEAGGIKKEMRNRKQTRNDAKTRD